MMKFQKKMISWLLMFSMVFGTVPSAVVLAQETQGQEVQTQNEKDTEKQEKLDTNKEEQEKPNTDKEESKGEQEKPNIDKEENKGEQEKPNIDKEENKEEQEKPNTDKEENKEEQEKPDTDKEENKEEQEKPNTDKEENKEEQEKPNIDKEENKEEQEKPNTDKEENKEEQEKPDTDKEENKEEQEKPNAEEESKEEQEKSEENLTSLFQSVSPLEVNSITGSIKTTVRFDYPQSIETIQKQQITAALFQGDTKIVSTDLYDIFHSEKVNGYEITTTAKDREGISLELSPNADEVFYFDIMVSGLPQGDYKMEFKGNGYKTYLSDTISLEEYSRHLILGTSDATFTVGDVDKNGAVEKIDRDFVAQALGKTDAANLEQYDINKDGFIDIVDIAYVNHQIGVSGEEKQYDTYFIGLDTINMALNDNEISIEGQKEDLFQPDSTVILRAKKETNMISIPIEFHNTVEMEQLEIISPSDTGAVESGKVIVEMEDGTKAEYLFGEQTSPDVHFTQRDIGTSTITVELGRRVAVKRVTIHVTKVQNQDTGKVEYVAIQQIKFLKDIVPENPVPANTTVRNLKAEAGNESVTLTWTELPNVTGYKVKYGLESGEYNKELVVDITKAVISGLENLKEYYFVVIPINGDWSGNMSAEVSATPQPSAAPLPPDQIKITPMDSALKVTWSKTENATYYKVYCRKNVEGEEFTLVDSDTNEGKITETAKAIGSLTNDIEYEVYVVAGNSTGESKPSLKAVGKPNKNTAEKPEGIPDGAIDNSNIESVQMPHKDYYDHDSYPNGFDVNNVIDGDYSTHWTARAFWESSEFTFTFKEAKEMNYLIYVPRLDGNYRKSLDTYTIKVDSGDGNFVVAGQGKVRNTPAETGFAILPFNKSMVKSIKISTAQWAGSPTNVSMSEVLFYEYDETKDLNGKITSLFADNAYTTLKSNVTAEQITELSALLEQNKDYLIDSDVLKDEAALALGLAQAKEDVLGVVHNGIFSRSGLQPLGVAAKAKTVISVYADIPEGEKVSIVATQYFAEASSWQKTVVSELENGRNVIQVPQINDLTGEHGGALYYTYSGSRGDEIKLQIRRATEIPTLELSDWYSISESERNSRIESYVNELKLYNTKGDKATAVLNSTEISMPNVLLSIPADKVQSALPADTTEAVELLYRNTLAWEEFMHIAKYTQGINETLENSDLTASRQNIRYMRMFGSAFMYAAGSHVGIGYGSCAGTVKGEPVKLLSADAKSNHLFGWGLGHEVGHNMDKLGKAEITNNIYSLMIQTYDGKDNTLISRLESSGKYDEIWKKTALSAKGSANDVFVQLGMYWQLHLAYDDGQNDSNGPMDFYHRFFQNWKDGMSSGMSYDDRVAVVASKTANKNLTEFFTRWGMELSDTAKSEISSLAEEPRAIWYLNDEARRYRLNGESGISPQTAVTLNAEVTEEKKVHLTFSSNAEDKDITGYEILRNGKSIAFTKEKEYTDIIGTANNLSFTYTVRAVDKLGMVSSVSNPLEIRISYDKTIDVAKYSMTRENTIVSAVMTETVPVTGIKITGVPSTGAYTVEVKKAANENFVVAKAGDFSDNAGTGADYVAYFNKPGAETADTRMWTYDAVEIKVTGVPENAQVQFISYPGDNISFAETAVGRLAQDYQYGDAPEDIIKKDTLVIMGAYRGDPVYNTIQISGKFLEIDQESDSEQEIERAIDGDALLFAEIPKDGKVSDISDGFFLFIPDVQKEAELQNKDWSACDAQSLLPVSMKAQLFRTDTPESTENLRLVSDTLWYLAPSDDSLPKIVIQGGN